MSTAIKDNEGNDVGPPSSLNRIILDNWTFNNQGGLEKSMQAPLTTRWWSISVLAIKFSKYNDIYLKGGQTCVNSTNTTEKSNVVASNLIRMCGVKWIVADIHFLAAISEQWLNKEFKWYKGKDPNIGYPGYISMHQTIRTYIQLRDSEVMENTWKESDAFATYRGSYEVLSPKTRKKIDMQRNYFFELMRMQIQKHNGCYLRRISIIRTVFGDQSTRVIFARLLECKEATPIEVQHFVSKIHRTTIALQQLYSF